MMLNMPSSTLPARESETSMSSLRFLGPNQ